MIDLPFNGSEDSLAYEPEPCFNCDDTGIVPHNGRAMPCPECRPDDWDAVIDGSIDP